MAKIWIAVALVVTLGTAPAASAGDCTCASLKEIQYRIQEIRALIAGYQAEIARIGQNPQFSDAAYKAFQKGTQQAALDAMKAANPGSPHTGGGTTHPGTCHSSFADKTLSACLLDAVKVHEAHHATVCDVVKGRWAAATPMSDYRDGKALAAAYQEEIDSYYLELDALDRAFHALPETCKPANWYLRWELAVTGNSSPNAKIKWSVSHTYSGMVELTDQGLIPSAPAGPVPTAAQMKAMTHAQQIAFAQAYANNMKTVHTWVYSAPIMLVPIDVAIDDSMRRKVVDRGEGDSHEDTTTTTTWKGRVQDPVQNAYRLEVDETNATYNLRIPIQLMGTNKTITVDVTTEIDRTPFGYGNAPVHEVPPSKPTTITPSTMVIPSVASVLDKGAIHHDKALPFAPKEDLVSFDSGRLKMDPSSTFMTNLPGAKTNVEVHVTYTLSKLPIQ